MELEELNNSIRRASELAQNLESNLPNLVKEPTMLCFCIDEIVNTFSAAKEKLLLVSQQDQTPAAASSSSFPHMLPNEIKQQAQKDIANPIMQEYAKATMDHFYQIQQEYANFPQLISSKMMDFPQLLMSRGTLQIGARDVVQDSEISNKGSEGEVQAMEPSLSPSPSSRPRRSGKKVDLEKRTTMVPAPEFGNTEQPPDDGFSWRKYGQKEILGSKYPRSYYRCTHQKLYECVAKKQVQRIDENPSMFQVTYRGNHTCHMSSTAPSSSAPQPQQQHSLRIGGSGGGDYPVVDMADAMFNSGSSSGNSMESLFPFKED